MINNRRKRVDLVMAQIFRITSFFSVIALIAIMVFILYEGILPFVKATNPHIRVVSERIDSIFINGTEYQGRNTFISIENDQDFIHIEFVNKGTPVDVSLAVNRKEKDPEKIVLFPEEINDLVTNPELYNYTITWPGALPGLEQKLHVNIPEPPHGVLQFLLGMEWRPVYRKLYGILPMIVSTILSTLGAALLGVPIALLASVLITEFMPSRLAALVRSSIDLLAGIPSVVYGFFGLMIIVPLIQKLFGSSSGSSLIAAVIILSIMILPTVVAIAITSLRAVPDTLREASLAMGATKMQTSWGVVFPAAKSGVIAGVILGISRAVGETMAVILVAGNSPQIPKALTDSVRTLTATIALEMGYSSGRHNEMLFSIGIVLFIMIFTLNSIILKLRQRITEVD